MLEALDREVGRAQRTGRPLSLILLAVDAFERCRHTLGARAADAVLRCVADVVGKAAREVDVVARYGEGEVFAVILPELELPPARDFAEKIRELVARERFAFEGRTISVTISTGVACVDASVANVDELLDTADQRLHAASAGAGA
jgi:diguanylate cyclase (GGDEF)-like protein